MRRVDEDQYIKIAPYHHEFRWSLMGASRSHWQRVQCAVLLGQDVEDLHGTNTFPILEFGNQFLADYQRSYKASLSAQF